MTQPRFPTRSNIGDELLSAYIDGQVTPAERQRVEQALVVDAQIRERYETMRMTINLMQNTPPMRVPRAFVLSEAQVLAAGARVKGAEQPGFWDRFFPRLMPLATAAVALLLVVLVSVDLLPGIVGGMIAPQSAMQEMEIAAAPVREEAVLMEMAAESFAAEAVETEEEVGVNTISAEPAKREGGKLAPQKDAMTDDSIATESDAAPRAVAEAPMAAAPPPPAPEEMTVDEVGAVMETAVESVAPAPNAAQAIPEQDEKKEASWLRPFEFILALLLLFLLVILILQRKQRHKGTP